ncbi:MAG: MFS transporter [Candidatus Bathyarchaeota archaeon]|nr:MFS transporter [Candidatus Bathyarchaeota archaeon]MDH5663803.1 MFS transporter [Candidatus Bathyarchaeota archaeon]
MGLRKSLKYAWFMTIILFLFRSFHTADIFVISVVLPQVLEEFQITYTGGGLIFTATFFMAVVLYPVWGYLYDRYSRKTLISLSGIIWGFTTWLNAIPKTFSEFFLTRTLTGIDDTPPSGMNSLVSDYFPPKSRGKPLGLISATAALGALIGTILGVIVGYATGWRMLFFITGGAGILMALLVYLAVRDVPRGSSEPELADLKIKEGLYRINFREFLSLVKKRSLLFLSLQGFFGVFPWQVLQAWIFTYMIEERGFDEGLSMIIMLVWLLSMIIGNLVGGMLGDVLFKRNLRGRAILGAVDVFLSVPALYFTIMWPREDVFGFTIIGTIASFILPMAGPNVSAAVTDIAEPEVRSSGDALLRIFEYGGSSAAPLISGYLADMYGLGLGILYISVTTWIICGILFIILAFVIAKDVLGLRRKMAERAEKLKALPSSQ